LRAGPSRDNVRKSRTTGGGMAVGAVAFDAEDFWEVLVGIIEAKEVIPVVDAELVTIEEGEKQVPLYRVVAERLLTKYILRPCLALNVCANTMN
jgi:hypothetical protein